MKFTKAVAALTAAVICLSLASCAEEIIIPSTPTFTGNDQISGGTLPGIPVTSEDVIVADDYFSNYDLTEKYDSENATVIELNGDTATVTGTGVTVGDGEVTVHAPGDFVFSGTYTGCIKVNIDKTEKAHLIFSGVTVNSKKSSAVHVMSADKVSITVAEGTVNTLSDAAVYTYAEGADRHDACVYAQDDLTINGKGKLTVTGNAKNGITCKNDLRLIGVELTVFAVNNAVKADDSIAVRSGVYKIEAGKDAVKVSDDPASVRGYIRISGGMLEISAADDGLQADVSVTVTGGKVVIHAQGKAVNCDKQDIASGTVEIQ